MLVFFVGQIRNIGTIKSDDFSIVCDIGGKRRSFEIEIGADETIAPVSFKNPGKKLRQSD